MMNKNLIRHKTLEILTHKFYQVHLKDYKNYKKPPEGSTNIPVNEICQKLKITDLDFRRSNVYTFQQEEIFYYTPEEVCVRLKGMHAYEDNKYLKMEWSEKNEKMFIMTKWLIPAAALLISILALVISAVKK